MTPLKTRMPKRSSGYLVASFENFPGVRIPLLSDEECKARGIEKGKFPPFDTWTPEQQAAGRELRVCLAKMAVTQAMRSVLRHLDAMQPETYTGTDPERDAIERALAELRAGKWKASRDDTSGLETGMIVALETMLSDLSPTASSPAMSEPGPKSRSVRKRRLRFPPKVQR
jgi:hypothetical protein